MTFRLTLAAAALMTALPALADVPDQPFANLARLNASRPAAIEANWTPLKLPNGDRIALASLSYLMAVNDEWGFGPGFYGAAKGNYGGIFTVGFTGQRRWRLGQHTHLAAGLYVGAGGGLSSNQLRFGGGLMLRPEISIRTETGDWYTGVSLSHVRFPNGNGNVSGSNLGFVIGRTSGFASFSPSDSGRSGRAGTRTGLGFDEITVLGGLAKPTNSTRNRGGALNNVRMGKAGAELRQYIADGSWWSVEASGAAQGGSDGYMEVLASAGQDWALFGAKSLRVGGQIGAGLGGGGSIDTGNGWLLRAGPSVRWITPRGASLRLDAALTRAPSGHFASRDLRVGLSMPLDQAPSFIGEASDVIGTVRTQQVFASVQQVPRVRFKDGSTEAVSHLAVLLTREFSPSIYGVAQAGSAALGKAGAYSFGLFGLGVQSPYVMGRTRFGLEGMVGAAGGGSVVVGGGAVVQVEGYAQWELAEHLRLRAGVGQWRTLRSSGQSSPIFNVSLGYAFGTLAR